MSTKRPIESEPEQARPTKRPRYLFIGLLRDHFEGPCFMTAITFADPEDAARAALLSSHEIQPFLQAAQEGEPEKVPKKPTAELTALLGSCEGDAIEAQDMTESGSLGAFDDVIRYDVDESSDSQSDSE